MDIFAGSTRQLVLVQLRLHQRVKYLSFVFDKFMKKQHDFSLFVLLSCKCSIIHTTYYISLATIVSYFLQG